jgi:hypothetical protein
MVLSSSLRAKSVSKIHAAAPFEIAGANAAVERLPGRGTAQ